MKKTYVKADATKRETLQTITAVKLAASAVVPTDYSVN